MAYHGKIIASFILVTALTSIVTVRSPVTAEVEETIPGSHRDTGGTLQKLKVSANGRYLVREDGSVFTWIGDSGWKVFLLDKDEMDLYLKNRKAKGFTVIQTNLGAKGRANAYGKHAFGGSNNDDIGQPLTDSGYDYWDHMDHFVDQAGKHGLYVAPVLSWRYALKGDPSKNYNYGKWIGDRYKDKDHIVWMGAGEAANWNSKEDLMALLNGIRDGDTGNKLVSSHVKSYSGTSKSYHNELDFNQWQTGQSRTPAVDGAPNVWTAIENDYNKKPNKPTLDAEAVYEGPNFGKNRYDGADHARRRAYWTIFAGAFGHTYGASGVWDSGTHKYPGHGRLDWKKQMDLEGAYDMGHLRALLESKPQINRIPDQSLIVSGQSSSYDGHSQAARDMNGDYAFIYIVDGRTIGVDLSKLKGPRVEAKWFNPRDGKYQGAGTHGRTGSKSFDPPGRTGANNDWVLVLESTD